MLNPDSSLLEPDRDQLELFVDALFRHAGTQGFVAIRGFFEDEDKAFRLSTTSLADGLGFIIDVAEDDARRAAQFPRPVVFCPPIAVFGNKDHAREVDLIAGPVLSVELDQHPLQALAKLESLLGPATVVVKSGGIWIDPQTGEIEDKLHAHWRLKKLARGDDLAKLKAARKLATAIAGGDPSNVPVSHPIRWPGSWHRKAEPRLCTIERINADIEIDLDEALAILTAAAPTTAGKASNDDEPNDNRLNWTAAFGRVLSGESYHPTLTPLAASCAKRGVPQAATHKMLTALMANSKPASPERESRRQAELAKLHETVRSGYGKFAPKDEPLFDPWAPFVVPTFPLEILPPVLEVFVGEQSNNIGACPSALAMSTLCACSGAIDHRFKVKMMRHGTWWAHPRIWQLLVGDPSQKKTPVMNLVTAALEEYQNVLRQAYEAALREHIKAGGQPADADAPNPPPRYVTWDATIEKLGEILARHDRGLLIKRDEFSGWIGQLEKYQHTGRGGADRAFYLQAFDGGPYAQDRIKRGETYIGNLSVSMIGGIQPARLAEISGLTSDGLLQRFLPVMMGPAKLARDLPTNDMAYARLIKALLAASPRPLSFDDDALGTMNELRSYLHDLEQTFGGVAEGMQAFIGKVAGYAGSLSIILHLAGDSQLGLVKQISRATVEGVARIVREFILPNAYEFYSLGNSGDLLRRIASFVLTSGKQRILASDFTSNIRDLRHLTLFEVGKKLSILVAAGWLDPVDATPACRAWNVSPAVGVQFVARAASEAERKAAVKEVISHAGRARREQKEGEV